MEHFVEFENVCKYYQTGNVKIAAADHLNFYVDKGEFCVIVGPSTACAEHERRDRESDRFGRRSARHLRFILLSI